MSKQFTMSMFASKEELYKTKAEYWEVIARDAVKYSLWEHHDREPSEQEIEDCIDRIESDLRLYYNGM
jgi:hypothetical protein